MRVDKVEGDRRMRIRLYPPFPDALLLIPSLIDSLSSPISSFLNADVESIEILAASRSSRSECVRVGAEMLMGMREWEY